jgi:DNA ligase-1
MLARPSEDIDAALERLGEAALEWKLDGARVQLHEDGDEVRVYSRRLNDVTAAVPELVEVARVLQRPLWSTTVRAETPDGWPVPCAS